MLGEPRSHVRGYLELLWESCYENGDPELGTAEDVALVADYPADPLKLVAALLTCGKPRAGFVDEEEPGLYSIHDLYDHAPEYVQRRMEREAERRKRGVTISDIRREAVSKRKIRPVRSNENKCTALDECLQSNGLTPAPAPAPLPDSIPYGILVAEVPTSDVPFPSEAQDKSAIQEFISAWNAEMGPLFGRMKTLTSKRRQKIKCRLREAAFQDLDALFSRIKESPFLRGEKTDWKLTIDFLITNEDNAVRILEGKYDKSANTRSHPTEKTASEIAEDNRRCMEIGQATLNRLLTEEP